MARWQLVVALDATSTTPLFHQIARAITGDIARGRLSPGQRLPGSRTLAATLAVHRNTVLAAYESLAAEAWLRARPGGGTFVADALPVLRPEAFSTERASTRDAPGFDLAPAEPPEGAETPRGATGLSDGVPDLRLVPWDAVAQAWRRALQTSRRALLGYGDPRGDRALRRALAAMVSETRGVACDEDRVLVTRGSQMALDLAARALLAPGDVVAVEAFGYGPAWRTFRRAGARVAPLPLDGDGLDVDAFEALLAATAVRALYLTPHHQYPTTVALSAARRVRLLALAARHRVAVLEDDYDHEFHYDGRPILPLASADARGVVVYLGTLSKVLAPGLRTGYVVAPRAVVERLAAERVISDRQGDRVTERALAELIDDGALQRHVRRALRTYRARRDACVESLERHLGGALRFRVPPGGLSLWAEARGVDVDAWSERALAGGVHVRTGRWYRVDDAASPHLRFGYGQHTEREFDAAVRALAGHLQ